MTVSPAALAVPALDHRNAPALQHRPAPCAEPPYDDERVDRAPAPAGPPAVAPPLVQGTLALSFPLPSGAGATLPAAPLLRLVDPSGPDGARRGEDSGDFGPQPTSSAALPSARAWAARVVQAIVEVLGGVRPVGQLVRWTTTEVYDEIAGLVVPGPRPCAPPRAVVRSVHVAEPADGVAEVCALVRRGARSTAVALRLEGRDGRWQCTALELG